MQSPSFTTLLSLLSFALSLAAGSPLKTLTKRDPGDWHEIVYLADCTFTTNTSTVSEFDYYKNYSTSGMQTAPPLGLAPLNTQVTWEGIAQHSNFRPGDFFTSLINLGADTLAPRQFAGIANNTAGYYFPCFRDAGQTVYTGDDGKCCKSKYFCIDSYTAQQFQTCTLPPFA